MVLLGMLVGLPFADAITGQLGPDVERAWRVAHTSLVTGGTLYIALAAIAHYLVLSTGAAAFVTLSLVISAYAFAFTLVAGPIAGARGLEPSGPPVNILIFTIFVFASLALLLSVAIVLWGLFGAMRRGSA